MGLNSTIDFCRFRFADPQPQECRAEKESLVLKY
jgi:hypothetical protein